MMQIWLASDAEAGTTGNNGHCNFRHIKASLALHYFGVLNHASLTAQTNDAED
jgi:hypothetical protein